jgi:hypothetical protein
MDAPDRSVDRPRWSLVVDNESVRRVRAMFRDLPESQQSGFLELTAAIPPVLLGCSSAGKLAFMRFEDVMMHRGAVPLASLAEAARRACGEEGGVPAGFAPAPRGSDCPSLSELGQSGGRRRPAGSASFHPSRVAAHPGEGHAAAEELGIGGDCCPLSARLGREWSDAAVRAWSDRFEELSCELGAKPSMRVCVT